MEKTYHIGFGNSHQARYAILPGDPGRVEVIAGYLEDARFYHQNREYTTWIGRLKGENVLVMSTGMGGPSTAIAVEELYQTGVTTCIRIGTCGGMQPNICGGDLVIANASVRMEGTSKEYVPAEYPAVSDFQVTSALYHAAQESGIPFHIGVVQSKDSFYGQHNPERMPVGYELMDKWNAWKKAGCLASEMESAALFITAQVLRMKAGCILSVVWNQERKNLGLTDTEVHDTSDAIRTAVSAIKLLIMQER